MGAKGIKDILDFIAQVDPEVQTGDIAAQKLNKLFKQVEKEDRKTAFEEGITEDN